MCLHIRGKEQSHTIWWVRVSILTWSGLLAISLAYSNIRLMVQPFIAAVICYINRSKSECMWNHYHQYFIFSNWSAEAAIVFNFFRNSHFTTLNVLTASPHLPHLAQCIFTTGIRMCFLLLFSCKQCEPRCLHFTPWNTLTIITPDRWHRPKTFIVLFSSHK